MKPIDHHLLASALSMRDEFKLRAERAESALTEERTRHEETVAMCEQLKAERDKAMAAAAEMRCVILSCINPHVILHSDKVARDHALSLDCGKDFVPSSELEKAEANVRYWVDQHRIESDKRAVCEHELDLARKDLAVDFERVERERDDEHAKVKTLVDVLNEVVVARRSTDRTDLDCMLRLRELAKDALDKVK